MLASARRRISLDGGKKGKGKGGKGKGEDDEFLLTATGDVQRASNSPMPIHEVLAAKDTPVAVRKALLDRHQILRCRVRNNSSLIGRTRAARNHPEPKRTSTPQNTTTFFLTERFLSYFSDRSTSTTDSRL